MTETHPTVRYVTSDTLPPSPGYSQAVEVRGGRLLLIAGQVAVDRAGALVGPNDIRAQTEQVFANLEAALAACGATFHDVVKLNSYFLDVGHLAVFRDVRDAHIDRAHPPASTAVQVSRLFRDGFLIEIEAMAVVPTSAP